MLIFSEALHPCRQFSRYLFLYFYSFFTIICALQKRNPAGFPPPDQRFLCNFQYVYTVSAMRFLVTSRAKAASIITLPKM